MRSVCVLLLALCFCAGLACAEEAKPAAPQPTEVTIDEIGVTTFVPAGWTVVTPDTVAQHFDFFKESTPEKAADAMRAEGVYVAAFNATGDAALRVIAQEGDETAALYRDIDRYTPAMRTAIKEDFLDREAWSLTGYRYLEAAWTNKANQGRLLRLTYSIRRDGATAYRGRQAYTIRNGLAITLDLRVTGRQVEGADERAFESLIQQTLFPMSLDMPKLPVGLTVIGGMPEEATKPELVLRGTTARGATVEAWLKVGEEQPVSAGQDKVGASGEFSISVTLPGAGEYHLFLIASLEGYADSNADSFVVYEPGKILVQFTSLPEGDVYDAHLVVSGKTLPGVTIQCMEGDFNKKVVTGSDGKFSIKLDRGINGPRQVTLSFDKKGYANRRVDTSFNRLWNMPDYVAYLKAKVQPLSYQNLCGKADKYVGRIVRYTGQVVEVTAANGHQFVQLALTVSKDGVLSDKLVAAFGGAEVSLQDGDRATLYVEVTGESFDFPNLDENGGESVVAVPSVKLLAYETAKP